MVDEDILTRAKAILEKDGKKYTDTEIEQMVNQLRGVAEVILDIAHDQVKKNIRPGEVPNECLKRLTKEWKAKQK